VYDSKLKGSSLQCVESSLENSGIGLMVLGLRYRA